MKEYKRRELGCGSTFEAEMFWIPYFKLEQGKLKVASLEIPPKFQKLKKLIEEQDIFISFKHNCYYSIRKVKGNTFDLDFLGNRILFEDKLRVI